MRALYKLLPLTDEQQHTLECELDWLKVAVPGGWGSRGKLMAMDVATDPFNVSQPQRLNRARWFAQIWNTFEFPHGVHLRRIHYRLVSQNEPVPVWEMTSRSRSFRERLNTNGVMSQYVNDKDCWNQLCEAGRDARLLNLVPAEAFVDRRNDEPQIFMFGEAEIPLAVSADGQGFNPMSSDWLNPPSWEIDTEEVPKIPQPYHVEVWAEKTTMNDILEPLCKRLGVNLVTGAGHSSLTMVDAFMERARSSGQPARILDVTDADKYGNDMAPATARKIEFRVRQLQRDVEEYADLDIQLRRIVLTKEQIADYSLPTAPDGKSVELDALEAIHPGVFGQIVEGEISRYRDPDLEEKTQWAFNAFKAEVSEASGELTTAAEDQEIADLERQQEALAEEFNERLAPLNARAEELFAAIAARRDGIEPPVFEEPEIEVTGPEDDDPLYDSTRNYGEQLERYKREGE